MALDAKISFGTVAFNQGNDDVGCIMSTSHATTQEELENLAEIFAYAGEFGQRMLSMQKYETAPVTTTEWTATTKGKTKGRLEIEFVFENGKKHKLNIGHFYNDEDLINAMVTEIKAKSAGAFGVTAKVETVNLNFIASRF